MRSIGVEDKEEMDLSVSCIFIYDDERECVCVELVVRMGNGRRKRGVEGGEGGRR